MSAVNEFILQHYPEAAPLTESDHPEEEYLEREHPNTVPLNESRVPLNPAEEYAVRNRPDEGMGAGYRSIFLCNKLDEEFGLKVQSHEENYCRNYRAYNHDFRIIQAMDNLDAITLHLFDEEGNEHKTRTLHVEDGHTVDTGEDSHPQLTCYCLSPVLRDVSKHQSYAKKLGIAWDENIRVQPHRYWDWDYTESQHPKTPYQPSPDTTPEEWVTSFDSGCGYYPNAEPMADSPFRDEVGTLLQSLGETYSAPRYFDLKNTLLEQELSPDALRSHFSVGKDENLPLELIIARTLNDDWEVNAEDFLLRFWVMSVRPTA